MNQLEHCTTCNQMTNHNNGICLKHTSPLEQIQQKAIEEMFDTEYITGKQPNLNPDTLKKVIDKAYQVGQDSIDKKIISQLAYDVGYKAGQEAERAKFVVDTQKLADVVPPGLLLNEIVNRYWQPCEHDYLIVLLSYPPQYQCIKCNQIKR